MAPAGGSGGGSAPKADPALVKQYKKLSDAEIDQMLGNKPSSEVKAALERVMVTRYMPTPSQMKQYGGYNQAIIARLPEGRFKTQMMAGTRVVRAHSQRSPLLPRGYSAH